MSTPARLVCLFTLLACATGFAGEPEPTGLKGHTKWVGCVAFSPDSKRLVSGSADHTARIWDVASGKAVSVLKAHADIVAAVDIDTNGAAVTGTYGGGVRLWLSEKRALTQEKRRGAILAVAFSRDGNIIAAGGMDGVITLMHTAGKNLGKLTGHKSWVNSLAFHGDRLVSGSSDGTVKLWDTKAKKLLRTFVLPDPREIRGVAISPDGKLVAAACRFGAVKVWNAETGKEVANLDAHEGEAWSVCFTPNGKTLVSGGGDWGKPGKVRLWDARTWKERAGLPHPAEVLCVAVSPDGRWLAVSGMGKTVQLWGLLVKK